MGFVFRSVCLFHLPQGHHLDTSTPNPPPPPHPFPPHTGSPVVPGSSQKLFEDAEASLYTVTILKGQYEAGFFQGEDFQPGVFVVSVRGVCGVSVVSQMFDHPSTPTYIHNPSPKTNTPTPNPKPPKIYTGLRGGVQVGRAGEALRGAQLHLRPRRRRRAYFCIAWFWCMFCFGCITGGWSSQRLIPPDPSFPSILPHQPKTEREEGAGARGDRPAADPRAAHQVVQGTLRCVNGTKPKHTRTYSAAVCVG